MTQITLPPAFIPTRREMVCGVAALAVTAVFVTPLVAQSATTAATTGAATNNTVPAMPAAFLVASSRLTGVALDQVALTQANQIWAALVPLYGVNQMVTVITVVQDTPDERDFYQALQAQGVLKAAQALVRTWYTGAANDQPTSVLFYDAALAWTVCTFTKPAGNCGGLTGYWALPWSAPEQETR